MPGAEEKEESLHKSEAIRWRVRLSDKAPMKVPAIVAVALLAFALGAFVFRNPLLGLLGFAMMFGSTAEYWLGSSYSVDEKCATMRTGLSFSSMEWDEVKRVISDEKGIKLSPLEKDGALDAFRGIYLRFGKDNRNQIERAVQTFGKNSKRDVVGGSDGGRDRDSGPESLG